MASTVYTGKFKRGQRVTWAFYASAISCQSSGLVRGVGKITGTEKANGQTMYVIDRELLLFEREVKRVLKAA